MYNQSYIYVCSVGMTWSGMCIFVYFWKISLSRTCIYMFFFYKHNMECHVQYVFVYLWDILCSVYCNKSGMCKYLVNFWYIPLTGM